ncbi:MAG TPA: glycosyltransferase [Caldisericia bacterium]|nr:glycosyltransferase [Caldisericia bacterium]
MIKILIVINSLEIGGAEKLLVNFVKEAIKYDDFEINICSLYSKNFFQKELEKTRVKIINLNLKYKYNFLGTIKIIKLIRKNNYELVHVHLFPAALFIAISSFFVNKNIKFIFTEHSVENRRRKYKIFKFIDFFIYSRFHKIICVSEKVKESLIKWIPQIESKSIVIKNGVPVSNNIINQKKIYDLLYVGRLEKMKGLDKLFESIKIIKNKYINNIKIAIVGDGSEKNFLLNLSKNLRIKENITFINPTYNIDDIMKKSKILVLPSRYEGLPMVILEAMSNKLPVISTQVGGISELIIDKFNGILINSDDVVGLSNSIIELLSNKNLYDFISKNAYEIINKEYNISDYTKKILNLYKQLLEINKI